MNEQKPKELSYKDMTDDELQSILNSLNAGIDNKSGCSDCPEPLNLIIARDNVEAEIESRK